MFVTRSYLPSKNKYLKYIDSIWKSHVLTNNGPFVIELEQKLQRYSACPAVLACSNGTIVMQMALKALGITKQVITTPFTYVATTNALLWEGCEPVFVDINPGDFTINTQLIEAAITEDTQAILATHVYGSPCDVERIESIALKHGLKVIYDAANAFGTTWKGKSIFQFGDISTCSFHATKLFHTGEGGALFINDMNYRDPLFLYRSFGHIYDNYQSVGINAKMSELHAAMGLCVFDDLEKIIKKRRQVSSWYDDYLNDGLGQIVPEKQVGYNYAYYPVLFKTEEKLRQAIQALNTEDVFPRRYFYPSLNKLPYIENSYECPVSEDISSRVLCLPLSHYLTRKKVKDISYIVNQYG